MALALIVAVIAAHVGHMSLALILLVFGAFAAGLFARSRGAEALDAAYGVLYLGWPCVLLIWLRDLNEAQGLYWTVLVFAVAWAADILAYLVGSAVGGPKLWPRFSPNKTWSGFIGGLLAGMIAGAAMAGSSVCGEQATDRAQAARTRLMRFMTAPWDPDVSDQEGPFVPPTLPSGPRQELDQLAGLCLAILGIVAGHGSHDAVVEVIP